MVFIVNSRLKYQMGDLNRSAKMKTFIILLSSFVISYLSAFAKDPSNVLIDIGNSDSLEDLVEHITLDTQSTIRVNPPVSQDFKNGHEIARKLHHLGVIKFLNLKGDQHPYPKLSKISSISIVSLKVTNSLKEQISGFNFFMLNKCIDKQNLGSKNGVTSDHK